MSKYPNKNTSTWLEKIDVIAQQFKAVLTKDYSMQDLRNLPHDLSKWFKDLSQSSKDRVLDSTDDLAIESVGGFSLKATLQTVQRLAIRQYKIFLLALLAVLVWITYLQILAPYSLRVQEQLEMRPAQWSQLQNLIRLSKASTSGVGLSTSSGIPISVSILDDQEMQKIRNSFNSRGLKTSVVRLSADNPPRLEFQASEIMFSVLLDALEELRTTWRLYPTQLSVVSNGGVGMVNVSGTLMQHGTNANLAGASQ